jgi:hypothetical protein
MAIFGWQDFEEAAPELAALGRERIERHGFVLVGTIRRDGTPRISPVGAGIVAGHLALNVLRDSLKARDLLRDDRILVHSAVLHADDPNDEFKLRGRAAPVEDPIVRKGIEELTWSPPPHSHVFAVDIEQAAFLAWSKGEVTIKRWSRNRGP